MAKLTDLPPEILAKIFTENGLESSDLAQVARVRKAFSAEATRANYIYNIEQERSSVVILAAQQGRIDWMQKAISMGAETNTVGPGCGENLEEWEYFSSPETFPDDGKYGTPLHYAALRGDDGMVALLLKSGTNLNVASFGLCGCMYNAITDEPPLNLTPRWLPLHHAVCKGHAPTAHLLLDHGAPLQMVHTSEDFSVLPDEPCDSLIHYAAARGLVTLVQRAMDMGTSASAPTRDDTTALHCTFWSWDSEAVIRCLVSAGADLDAKGWLGVTPLFRACSAGNFSTALHLLKAGSDIRAGARRETEDMESKLLYLVASGGSDPIPHGDRPEPLDDRDQEQVEFLRTLTEDYGMSYDESYRKQYFCDAGWQSLHNHALISAACCNEYVVPGVVKFLLDNGSDPNHPNLQGNGPLRLLLSNVTPSGKWILRDNANKYRKVVYMLVEYGARVSHVRWDLLEKMRLWAKDKRVCRDDRVLFEYLLRKFYKELAAEDETSADDSREDGSEEDEFEEDEEGEDGSGEE